MKKIEEQLESIEELLSVMIKKNASIEELIQKSAESQTDVLASAMMEMKGYPSGQLLESRLSTIQKRIEDIPATLPVRNHHHFNLSSKGFIISAAVLLIVTALSTAVAISGYRESSRLRESDLKFRIARQLSPAVTARVDSIYYKDPGQAEFETQKLEARELSVRQAEKALNQRQMEAKEMQELLKKLKQQ